MYTKRLLLLPQLTTMMDQKLLNTHQELNHQELLSAMMVTFSLSRLITHIQVTRQLATTATMLSIGAMEDITAQHVKLISAKTVVMVELSHKSKCLLKDMVNQHMEPHQCNHQVMEHHQLTHQVCNNQVMELHQLTHQECNNQAMVNNHHNIEIILRVHT